MINIKNEECKYCGKDPREAEIESIYGCRICGKYGPATDYQLLMRKEAEELGDLGW